MVGPQNTSIRAQLGPLLNCFTNYDFWLPVPKMLFPGVPPGWCEGFHVPAGPCAGEVRQDPGEDMLLIHLHKTNSEMAP